jgi:hypothetical protein
MCLKLEECSEISSSHGGEYELETSSDIAPCNLVEVDGVSEVLPASIIALMMEVLRTQKHRSTSTRLHGAVSEREE